MIQETALRLSGEGFLPPVVICGQAHAGITAQQLTSVGLARCLTVLEPFGRNTAAVAAIASLCAREIDSDAVVLLLPADHVIADAQGFRDAVTKASVVANTHVVTFGIRPERPETGFGYIQIGKQLDNDIFAVEGFLEKPDLETAQRYTISGKHVWNAGIFLFSSDLMLGELASLAPDVLRASTRAFELGERSGTELSLDAAAFAEVPSISIDYAVMEKTTHSAVVPCDIGWADVGGFAELWRLGEKDGNGNHLRGPCVMIDGRDNLIFNDGEAPVAVIGLSDVVVVKTASGVVVCPRDRVQEVKAAAECAIALAQNEKPGAKPGVGLPREELLAGLR